MSDRVIRLGGSHIGNAQSINNINSFIAKEKGRKLIVVSAIPELLEVINESITTIFQVEIDADQFLSKINRFFTDRVGGRPSSGFANQASKLTNLLKGIALIGDYSKALRDQVLSYSEQLSVEILLSQWRSVNSNVHILIPAEIGLKATSDHGSATLFSVDTGKINSLKEGIYIVPGSYGIEENGKIARTGYTAADYTAAFLTRELKLAKLELWDLDRDFMRADPALVKNNAIISRLTYSEASELAYFDHYSFHPRTVEPLEHEHIPIEVIRSDSAEGVVDTVINTETYVEDQIVKSVACTEDISLLKLDGPGVGLKPGILAKVTTKLNDAGINIKSVITSQTSINFILGRKNGDKALSLVQQLGFSSVQEVSVVKDISLIGVVGHGMQHAYGVSAKIFTAVANNKINVVLSGSGASDLVSYLIVNTSDKAKSVNAIYNAFYNPK